MSFFDFNGNGSSDGFDTIFGLQMTATSREEAIEYTGCDSFYKATNEQKKNTSCWYLTDDD